jgi:hypothetical protein
MPTVFVVQESDRNILPAKEFGELKVILSHNDVSKGAEHMVSKIKKFLNGITGDDYILCIGDPVAIGLTIHLALAKTYGVLRILRWNKHSYSYEVENLNI